MINEASIDIEVRETKIKEELGNLATHKIVAFIVNSNVKLLQKVSKSTISFKPFIKVPLLFLMGVVGMVSAYAFGFTKMAMEIINHDERLSLLAFMFLSLAGALCLVLCYLFNLA